MKTTIAMLIALVLIAPVALAVDTGSGLGIDVDTEAFDPLIWMCDHRYVMDDNVESARISEGGEWLVERVQNYAFEGEQVEWRVLVMDKNGIEKIEDVYASAGPVQGDGNFIEANCELEEVLSEQEPINEDCNARIDEEELCYAPADNVMAYYICRFTVETPDSMHGQYWVTTNVVDLDAGLGTMDENEFWFFNPVIALTLDGFPISFGTVRPGTTAYSNTLTVGNGAEIGSGVMLDMFVTGTDFYDPAHSGAKCPSSNQMALTNFRYYATQGAYSTEWDQERDDVDSPGDVDYRNKDEEGYVNIEYGDYFSTRLYDNAEVIQSPLMHGPYYKGNELSPGSEMSVTFKLDLPIPCNGDFTDGNIYFWGEAI
jgi:hypothetical protein